MDLIKTLTANYMKPELPQMNVGDTVCVTLRVKEGSRERNQVFEGTIIARKHGGINETISSLLLAFYAGFTAHPHVPVFVSIGAVEVGLALYVYHIARSGRLRTPAVLDSQ